MKRCIAVFFVLIAAAVGLSAGSITEDREIRTLQVPEGGQLKAGLLLGYPSGLTLGYRMSNWFEGNMTVGYIYVNADSALVSANGLFTLLNIPLGEAGVMPLSLGPQVNFIFGGEFYMDAVADLRLEYTFPEIPLNLFTELGVGVRFFNGGDWLAIDGGLGVRYVF